MKRTLVVYSGPTSLDKTVGKNGMYIDNFNYFLEYGVSCHHLLRASQEGSEEGVSVHYAIVLTRDVATYYTSANGGISIKQHKCEGDLKGKETDEVGWSGPLIKTLIREDRCYDMESIRVVLREIDVQSHYDYLVFLNCGLVGPKFGPGSPTHDNFLLSPDLSKNTHSRARSHWTQLYTSHLSDSIQIVGQSINLRDNHGKYDPHVQSFLYAITTQTALPIILSSGAIYDCNLSQKELVSNQTKRAELIHRYEVGMSSALLKHGYSIASSFLNQAKMGSPLVLNKSSIFNRELTSLSGDVWHEDGLRRLTSTLTNSSRKWWKEVVTETSGRNFERFWFPEHFPSLGAEDSFEEHMYDILPWDYFVFFKVSRLVPQEIQSAMRYLRLEESGVPLIPNDPRKSPGKYWRRKAGVTIWDEREKRLLYSSSGGLLTPHCGILCVPTPKLWTGILLAELLTAFFFLLLIFKKRPNKAERNKH